MSAIENLVAAARALGPTIEYLSISMHESGRASLSWAMVSNEALETIAQCLGLDSPTWRSNATHRWLRSGGEVDGYDLSIYGPHVPIPEVLDGVDQTTPPEPIEAPLVDTIDMEPGEVTGGEGGE